MFETTERPRRKRLSWESRCEIVALIEAGVSPAVAAVRGGASRATGYRLWRRYQEGGWQALRDRPSTPWRQPRRLPVELEERILVARRQTSFGPVRLAGVCPHPPSTIGKVLGGVPANERLEGTLATTALGIARGADIVRVHDVAANVRAARMADAIVRGTWHEAPTA